MRMGKSSFYCVCESWNRGCADFSDLLTEAFILLRLTEKDSIHVANVFAFGCPSNLNTRRTEFT